MMMPCRRPHPPCFSKWLVSSVNHTQTRCVRTKRGLDPHDASLKRDERLLKRLEAQLANVQAQIKREEKEAKNLLKQEQKRNVSQSNTPLSEGLQDHNALFWETVLSKDDRRRLVSHGINSMEELASTYDAIESKFSQQPHPKIEALDTKSRHVYEIYKSIPSKLQEVGRRKATSWFGSWF